MIRNAPLSAVLNEEVALEGLEGTTLDALWNHLAIRLKMKMPLPQKFCDTVWPLIVQHREYSFYELPESRKPFVAFDRMANVDPSTGVMKEPKVFPGHRFKYNPVSANGAKGSCELYDTRVVVPREELAQMSHQDVEAKWPNKFVIVASQKMRESFVIDPNCTLELTVIQYCMLEWIARSRFNGETSQGKFSLVELTKDSSILYYNRKFLTDCKLITRQALCQRTGETSIQGMVYHLPRYYNEMKPKTLVITEKVVNILKQRPGFMADYDEIKHVVLGRAEARKWFRGSEFAKFVRTDETVPYRQLYPEADKREWQLKNKRGEEKQVRVMRLIDPEADVFDVWYKEELPEEDQKDGILNSQKAFIDMPVLQQAYNEIAKASEQGISQSVLATQMGLDKLNSRAVVKNLVRLKAVEGHAVDEGRQRTTKYFIPGKSLRTTTFDKEAIQLMSTHLNVVVQQTNQQNSSGSVRNESSSGILNTDLDSQTDDDDKYLLNPKVYAVANTLIDSIDVEVSITNEVLFLKKAQSGISAMMNTKHISAKVLKRCNQILELVKMYHVIEPREILKKINKDEKASGYKAEACHKSVLRLLGKLAMDKFLRIANVKLTKEDKELNVAYACDMSVEQDNPMLKGKIEAAKSRMMLASHGPHVSKKQLLANDTLTAGCSYEGTLAKCLRMKLFHEFLFYVIYLLTPDTQLLPSTELEGLDLTDVGEELGPIYSTDSWKLFIPPLNIYESYGDGWALLTDITLRLPLSIFCQICTFGFYTKDLDYYLNHPIRRHILIKQLPRAIRQQLFRQRKYIFNIFELTSKLCYIGLLQFGPQRMKDRDQTYIYLNRNCALLDTRTSRVGYNEIEDKEYPILGFTFEQAEHLASYWETLYKIAMETQLNRRSVAFGKEILVQQLQLKPDIVEASKPRTAEQAYENDVQRLPPGDGRGAAGIDTAMFVHLKSNWSKIMNYAPADPAHQRAKIKKLKTMKKLVTSKKDKLAAGLTGNSKRLTAPKEKKLCLKAKLTVKPFASAYRRYGEKKQSVKIRKIESRAVSKRLRNHYDEVDRKALKLMKKLRVDWSRNEDAILLTCRIAVKYLYGEVNKSNSVINSGVYRDILHWSDPNSANKTSRACQRRIHYMVRHKQAIGANVKMCVEEAKLNPLVEERFGNGFIAQMKEVYTNMDDLAMALKVHFVELVHLLRKTLTKLSSVNFRLATDAPDSTDKSLIPDTIVEFQNRFNILQSHNKSVALHYDKNPKQTEEIIMFKLATLIHSAVTNVKDSSNFNVQLFNIYKNYSEKQLSQAMKMVRSFRLISLVRKMKTERIFPSSIMPALDNPYRVSISYMNQLLTKVPFEMFNYVYYHYLKLLDRTNYEEMVTFEDGGQGLMLLLAELITMDAAELDLDIPADFIRMNPELRKTHPDMPETFRDFSFTADEEQTVTGNQADQIKTEPKSSSKVHFDNNRDVIFNYVMHPVERLTKVPSEYLHFFCLLNSISEKISLKAYTIDESNNLCSVNECLLQGSERNIIPKCIAIAMANREVINRIKTSKLSRLEMLPMFVVRENNIAQFFTKTIQNFTKTHTEKQKRDLGRMPDGLKTPINMVTLADEIVRFESVSDFNWLDRYEITQVEEDEDIPLLIDTETNDTTFSREVNQKDELTEKVHRLHNFYVVQYLKLNLRLTVRHPNQLAHRVKFGEHEIPKIFLPPTFDQREDLQTKITGDALWPLKEELSPLLEQAAPLIYQNPRLCVIADFIEGKEQAGATVYELAERFRNRSELCEGLQTLTNCKFVLRTGYRYVTYVHWRFVQPWLVRTTCVIRDAPDLQEQRPRARVKQEQGPSHGKRPIEKSTDEDSDVQPEPPRKSRRAEIEQRVEELETRDRYKPKKNLTLSVVPWLKVDGGVNRRLLYRWLTTLLLYCMSHPGVLTSVVYSRFTMMAPVHLSHLLDMLKDYGCLKLYAMEVRQKRTLFSTYRSLKIEKATEFDREEQTYIEATPNALTTLTMLIGDYAKFQEDFLIPSKYVDMPDESAT